MKNISSQENLKSMTQIEKNLKDDGDFLKITCANEWSLPDAFSFEIKAKETSIKVNVLDTGFISFEPDCKTTKDIVLSSAIHGNETAPIEICNNLIKQAIKGQLPIKQRVLFIFGNPAAINIGKRFVEENMNRLFSGEHSNKSPDGQIISNRERTRAKAIEDVVRAFYQQGERISGDRSRYHYDLHTAIRASKSDKFAVYPFQHNKPRKKDQLLFLKQCGINTVLLSHSPTTAFSYFTVNEFGADAFTVELGKVKPFGENNMEDFSATIRTLTALICDKNIALGDYKPEDFNVFEIYQSVNREAEDFRLNFADDVENFTSFPLDYVLAEDGNRKIKVTKEGEAIIFPNAEVAIGQRALLTVIPTQIL